MRSPSALPTNATWIQGELAGKVDVTKKHKNVRSEPNKTFVWINSQIVASSQSGSTLQDLVRTIREYLNEMNLVNLTTAMHRLGKMVSHDAKAQGYLKQCHILPQLLKLIAEMLETTPAKSIQAQSLSNLLWALASIKVVDTEVILLVCHHSLSSIDRFKPYELSTLLWALAKLSTLDCNSGCKLEQLELIFDFARKPLRQYARSMECRCLSMVVWAYATVDKVDEELFAMVGALVANRPALTCQEMANIIWAFGSQHVFHGDLFESLAQKGVQTIKDFKAQDLSNMLCGFASVGFFHEDFFEQAARETLSKNVPSQYLANIIWAFAHVCPNHPLTKQFFLAIVPPCRLQLSTFKPQEVCIVALAVAKTFRCFEQSSQLPSVILHFFRTISHIRTSMADFSSQCLADMATAFAMVLMGAQTNDSNKDLVEYPMKVKDYETSIFQRVGPRNVKRALELYPPNNKDLVQNVHILGSVNSDAQLCNVRRRVDLVNRHNPGKGFMYRFNYWYQSNPKCSADPNYHDNTTGPRHEDEMMFTLGQPIFMFDGACCGKWGNRLKAEPCAQKAECVACWDPSFGEGYHAYFNDKEWEFSQLVGKYWANFARYGTPNGPRNGAEDWPVFHGKTVNRNLVLDANLPGGRKIERTLYDDPAICSFWDTVDDVHVVNSARDVMEISV